MHRSKEDFEPRANDSDYVRGFKLRRRIAASFSRGQGVAYKVPTALLRDYYFQEATLEGLKAAARQLETDTHQMIIALGKILDSIQAAPDEDTETEVALAIVHEQQGQVVGRLEELVSRSKERVNHQQWTLLVTARDLASRFSADIDRLDVRRLIKKERRVSREAAAAVAALGELPGRWKENQARLVELADLAIKLSSFQHRLTAIAGRERDQVALEVKNGVLSQCETLAGALDEFHAKLGQDAVP